MGYSGAHTNQEFNLILSTKKIRLAHTHTCELKLIIVTHQWLMHVNAVEGELSTGMEGTTKTVFVKNS